MSHLNDDTLEELDQLLIHFLPEDYHYLLITADPVQPNPAQSDYDMVSNVPPPKASIMLKHIVGTLDAPQQDEPSIPWAG